MTAVPDWDMVSDAELAGAGAAGDRGAFAGIYDRYADRLHDFCVGMLRDRDAAADCVQDVFCTAADRLPQLRDGDKLRPWLYAIARHEALRRIRERGRERVFDEVPEQVSPEPGPDTLAARTELADLIAEAAGGLSERDRAVLELAYRHGLDGPELAQALDVSHASAKKMTQRLRETIERSLGALLVSRGVQNNPRRCAELAAILDGWDGTFTVLMRKRIARHIESCPTCDEQRRRLVNPVALLGGVPVFIPAPDWLREHTLSQVHLTASTRSTDVAAQGNRTAGQSDGATAKTHDQVVDGGRRLPSRGVLLTVAVVVAILLGALALTIARLYPHSAPVTPANVTPTTTAPTTTAMTAAPRTTAAPPPTAAPAPPVQEPDVSNRPATTPRPPPATPSGSPPAAPAEPTIPETTPPSAEPPAPPSATPVAPTKPTAPPQLPPQEAPAPPTTSPVTPTKKPVVSQPPRPPVVRTTLPAIE